MSLELSICIVIYKNYDDIKNAIESLEKYTAPQINKKVFVVDNTDLLSEECKQRDFIKFASKYKDVEYLKTGENLGFGKGHNFVLNCLDSKYHAIVNPDIIFCEDAFSSIISYMDSNNDVGMVIPDIRSQTGERQMVYREELTVFDMFSRYFCRKLFRKRAEKHTMQNQDYTKPFNVPFGQGSFLVIRTDLFKELGGFDEKYFMYVEDADLCKRVNAISKLMYYPGAKVIHKWEKGSHSNSKLFRVHLRSALYYFRKWGLKLL